MKIKDNRSLVITIHDLIALADRKGIEYALFVYGVPADSLVAAALRAEYAVPAVPADPAADPVPAVK